MAKNYFNSLPLRLQLEEVGTCRFMDAAEFAEGVSAAQGLKIVIVGCGAQGLNQGWMNLSVPSCQNEPATSSGAVEASPPRNL